MGRAGQPPAPARRPRGRDLRLGARVRAQSQQLLPAPREPVPAEARRSRARLRILRARDPGRSPLHTGPCLARGQGGGAGPAQAADPSPARGARVRSDAGPRAMVARLAARHPGRPAVARQRRSGAAGGGARERDRPARRLRPRSAGDRAGLGWPLRRGRAGRDRGARSRVARRRERAGGIDPGAARALPQSSGLSRESPRRLRAAEARPQAAPFAGSRQAASSKRTSFTRRLTARSSSPSAGAPRARRIRVASSAGRGSSHDA